jgi:transposase
LTLLIGSRRILLTDSGISGSPRIVVPPSAPRLGFGLPASLRVLQALIVQIDVLTDQITEQLHAHADAHIFRSLPRAQALRAARLLAEIGDARGRFPTP